MRPKLHNSGAPTDTTDHSPRLQERENDFSWVFIHGCEERVGWDVGISIQDARHT